jgi:hypothetical protein
MSQGRHSVDGRAKLSPTPRMSFGNRVYSDLSAVSTRVVEGPLARSRLLGVRSPTIQLGSRFPVIQRLPARSRVHDTNDDIHRRGAPSVLAHSDRGRPSDQASDFSP